MSAEIGAIPNAAWKRRLDEKLPTKDVHVFSRPPILEALSLLPVAYRVGSYISHERQHGREPIFDLNGIALEPPNPGPFAGVPCGGMGSGCIGRGFRGDFRRWSLHPGRYIHRVVQADQFSIRVKRNGVVHSQVLSLNRADTAMNLSSWKWQMPANCATYHASFPRSWTVYESPVPGVRVIIRQVSPFLPHSYSEASLPVCLFHVDVENTGAEDAEVSVMFSFQNGDGGPGDAVGGFKHCSFDSEVSTASLPTSSEVPQTPGVRGVCMTRLHYCGCSKRSFVGSCCGQDEFPGPPGTATNMSLDGSMAIAAAVCACNAGIAQGENFSTRCADCGVATTCEQFVTQVTPTMESGAPSHAEYRGGDDNSASVLWRSFVQTGDISSVQPEASSTKGRSQDYHAHVPKRVYTSELGRKVGAAVCLRKVVKPGREGRRTFSFSLSWDNPVVRFGSGVEVPRFYSRFFGLSGRSAPAIAIYALLYGGDWEERIVRWQRETLERAARSCGASDDSSIASGASLPEYYRHLLFNELYFLVDGGSVWTDTINGEANPRGGGSGEGMIPTPHDHAHDHAHGHTHDHAHGHGHDHQGCMERSKELDGGNGNLDLDHNHTHAHSSNGMDRGNDGDASQDPAPNPNNFPKNSSGIDFSSPPSKRIAAAHGADPEDEMLYAEVSKQSISFLRALRDRMLAHDVLARGCEGDQTVVGQFLYLEGHEYLMYNTYDVHFYSGFGLMMLWPELELSLQKDFATAVNYEDPTKRRMMGEGDIRPRKVKGVVPHDLGSPSEHPWAQTNAYNFQDVSNWKDLGPKFVLQVYRDYHFYSTAELPAYACTGSGSGSETSESSNTKRGAKFFDAVYDTVLRVMDSSARFDTDRDGMIENSGFPDQTYDIWTAKGVHAYCGGLWAAACSAAQAMASLRGDAARVKEFSLLAERSRFAYVNKLWNGRYLDYDNSTSSHQNSIMADMLAGQWYARACGLPAVLSGDKALSCYRTIFEFNVKLFGNGRWLGAVNGMRPDGSVDSCCLQSREVWTGTTYGLAAGMLHEAKACAKELTKDGIPTTLVTVLSTASSKSENHNQSQKQSDVLLQPRPGSDLSSPVTTTDEELSPLSAVSLDDSQESTMTKPLLVKKSASTKAGASAAAAAATMTTPRSPSEKAVGGNQSSSPSSATAIPGHPVSKELSEMGFNTARGIHDAGWQEFGYWFATPEGWEQNGNYRSLGYMRPVAIWAMQYALEQVDTTLVENRQ